jgi:hypothetical protein
VDHRAFEFGEHAHHPNTAFPAGVVVSEKAIRSWSERPGVALRGVSGTRLRFYPLHGAGANAKRPRDLANANALETADA